MITYVVVVLLLVAVDVVLAAVFEVAVVIVVLLLVAVDVVDVEVFEVAVVDVPAAATAAGASLVT